MARLGELNLDPSFNDGATPLDVPIKRIISHEGYDSEGVSNDIALLKLNHSVAYTGTFFHHRFFFKLIYSTYEPIILIVPNSWKIKCTIRLYEYFYGEIVIKNENSIFILCRIDPTNLFAIVTGCEKH